MLRTQLNQRLFSWIAIFAILLNTLMPLVSQAVELKTGKRLNFTSQSQVSESGAWQELCSANGSVWIKLAADGSILAQSKDKPADAPISIHLEHCSYCVTHAGSFGLAVTQFVYSFVLAEHARSYSPLSTFFHTQIAWMAPAVRAPPRLIS
ncbi:DUF2946 domain-containing protein [Undibacterium macrobrachii]|uniref:DUF2946 domain-containing protein n=1 Tax=Undibacterium macrobrachii TaxID=1119058 RepID=UPI0016725A14|nr:DUF2946 domain-containing protein [Undibacterium macrobrachii]